MNCNFSHINAELQMAASIIKLDRTTWVTLGSYGQYCTKNGWVFVRTYCSNLQTVPSTGHTIGTLPSELRPSVDLDFGGTSLAGTNEVMIRISANGKVTMFSNPAGAYWSGCCSYPIGL